MTTEPALYARVTMFRGSPLPRAMWVRVIRRSDIHDWWEGKPLHGPPIPPEYVHAFGNPYGRNHKLGFDSAGRPDKWQFFPEDQLPNEFYQSQALHALGIELDALTEGDTP